MKHLIILLFFLFNSFVLIAQTNAIKIGVGTGTLAYEHGFATNVECQYEYELIPRLSPFIAVGTTGKKLVRKGVTYEIDGDVTLANAWEYEYSERFNYADFGLKYRLFKLYDRYEMKALIGGTLAQSRFNYPARVVINRGVIEERIDVQRNSTIGLMLFGLENNVYISDRFIIGLNVIFRTTFYEKHRITREIIIKDELKGSATSGILNVANMNLQFGYLF